MPHKDILEQIHEIADVINSVLNKKRKDEYFESVALLYSFIENILKWLVFVEATWVRAKTKLTKKDTRILREFSRNLNFYSASNVAYSSGLIDLDLYMRISGARMERNRIIHKFWMYERRGNKAVMRKKLEKLARIANDLVSVLDKLTRKIGVDEVFDVTLD
jgi:hypothetical protein